MTSLGPLNMDCWGRTEACSVIRTLGSFLGLAGSH